MTNEERGERRKSRDVFSFLLIERWREGGGGEVEMLYCVMPVLWIIRLFLKKWRDLAEQEESNCFCLKWWGGVLQCCPFQLLQVGGWLSCLEILFCLPLIPLIYKCMSAHIFGYSLWKNHWTSYNSPSQYIQLQVFSIRVFHVTSRCSTPCVWQVVNARQNRVKELKAPFGGVNPWWKVFGVTKVELRLK